MKNKLILSVVVCTLTLGSIKAFGSSVAESSAVSSTSIAEGYSVHSDYLGGLPEGIVLESNIWVQPSAGHADVQDGRVLCFLDITALDAEGRAIAHVAGPTEVIANWNGIHTSGTFSIVTPSDDLIMAEVLFTPAPGTTWGALSAESPVNHSLVIHE